MTFQLLSPAEHKRAPKIFAALTSRYLESRGINLETIRAVLSVIFLHFHPPFPDRLDCCRGIQFHTGKIWLGSHGTLIFVASNAYCVISWIFYHRAAFTVRYVTSSSAMGELVSSVSVSVIVVFLMWVVRSGQCNEISFYYIWESSDLIVKC